MAATRVRVAPVEGAATLFTSEFNDYLLALHDRLGARVHDLIAQRAAMLERAHKGTPPGPLPPSPATHLQGVDRAKSRPRLNREEGDDAMNESARPPTPYERFVAATKAILSVSKKDVDAEMRKMRIERKRKRKRGKS